jgi:hypothetical protein
LTINAYSIHDPIVTRISQIATHVINNEKARKRFTVFMENRSIILIASLEEVNSWARIKKRRTGYSLNVTIA